MTAAAADPRPLQAQVILVTGAGAGIGQACAKACAAAGATVVLLGKTIPKLEQTYDAIVDAGGPEPAIYPLNLEGASPKDYDALTDKLADTFGRLDAVLHCAGLLPYLSRLKDHEPEDWMKVMQVNLNAPFLLTQSLLPLLGSAPAAQVIFTADDMGGSNKAYWGAYAVAKRGLEALCDILADETAGTNIRVNAIDPGATATSLRQRVFPAENPARLHTPAAVAQSYLWLLGPAGRDCHGQTFKHPVSGG